MGMAVSLIAYEAGRKLIFAAENLLTGASSGAPFRNGRTPSLHPRERGKGKNPGQKHYIYLI